MSTLACRAIRRGVPVTMGQRAAAAARVAAAASADATAAAAAAMEVARKMRTPSCFSQLLKCVAPEEEEASRHTQVEMHVSYHQQYDACHDDADADNNGFAGASSAGGVAAFRHSQQFPGGLPESPMRAVRAKEMAAETGGEKEQAQEQGGGEGEAVGESEQSEAGAAVLASRPALPATTLSSPAPRATGSAPAVAAGGEGGGGGGAAQAAQAAETVFVSPVPSSE